MAYQKKAEPFKRDTSVVPKDLLMLSQNALNAAVQAVALEVELGKHRGEDLSELNIRDRIETLYDLFGEWHNAKVEPEAQAAGASVVREFPGSKAEPVAQYQPAQPASSGDPGSFVVNLKKHQGKTIAQVFQQDPGYINGFLATDKFEPKTADLKALQAAAKAFLNQGDDPYAG